MMPRLLLPSLAERNAELVEQMDRPDCDPVKLRRSYQQFGVINRLVSGWRRIYRRQLRPHLAVSGTTTLLDIGSGAGDIPRALLRWAAADGFSLEVTAIDPDSRAHAFATAQEPVPGLTFRQAYSSELVAENLRFDLVTSNHMLHHLSAAELDGLLRDSERLCRIRAVHNDLARSRISFGVFGAVSKPLFHGSYIHEDGLASIRRSYTAEELRRQVPPGWRVNRRFPYHLLLSYEPGLSRA